MAGWSLGAGAACADDSAFAPLEDTFHRDVAPVIRRYCIDCHSTDEPKGDVDLEQFLRQGGLRANPQLWEKSLEMLRIGEMPPEKKPQPAEAERGTMESWIAAYLDAEAETRSGDPGRVVLRRLNNTEYTLTIRDLTGVDLDPAAEFPVDGAAGEGFVNTGDALSMSPAMLEKYFTAAQRIAAHAVLLPDGFAFSAGEHRGDHVNEKLEAIRRIYGRHTSADGGTRINLQGIEFETNEGGRLALDPYFAALLREAAGSAPDPAGLNQKFLSLLRTLLTEGSEPGVLAELRRRFRESRPGDGAALAGFVQSWQDALTRFQNVGHMKPWIVPVDPVTDAAELRVPVEIAGDEALVYLVTGTAGDGSDGDAVVWENPRLVAAGRADVSLAAVAEIAEKLPAGRAEIAAGTAEYFAALEEISERPSPPDARDLAARHGLDAAVLDGWLRCLGFTGGDAGYELFQERMISAGGYEAVSGWGRAETPQILANSSGQDLHIPGHARAHGVVVHPSPDLDAGVGWVNPDISGRVQVEARITHAHPACGNGVTWSLEWRRGSLHRVLAAGVAHGQELVTAGPLESPVLRKGDVLLLVIGARDSNHACDLTDVELVVREPAASGREWFLTADVASDIASANPHPDREGRPGVWQFFARPAGGVRAAYPVPEDSLLARWQMAADAAERSRVASELQALLTADPPPSRESGDGAVRSWIESLSGPFAGVLLAHPGDIPVDREATAPSVKEFRVPRELAEGAEVVARVRLANPGGAAGSVQARILMKPPAEDESTRLVPGVPVVASAPRRATLKEEFDAFRRWFPPALCYPKIVPVDEVITLTVFHREDEPLVRLMLSDAEAAELDRLWEELHFVGQDALTMVDALAQLLEYATQDADPSVFEPLREPIARRAEEFRRKLAESEPVHLDALVRFAERAWRRPLREGEEAGIRDLYASLRREEFSHDEAFRLTLARVLTAPSFLYRIEEPAAGDGSHPVSAWELASRLSYLLWSSMPDDALRARAAGGELTRQEVLLAEARRMLADSRARALATEFACQWLHLRGFDTFDEKSTERFPEFGDLRDDMYEETVLFFLDLFQRDGSILEILDADHTFLNEALATHYGIPGVKGPEFRRVDGIRRYGRGGVLGFATVLSKNAGASRTSPILRGNWVVETLLGDRLPDPPPNVPVLPESDLAGPLSMRRITELHSTVPECASCHRRIDPFGFALEQYDAIGRFQVTDGAGRPVDASAKLSWRDDSEFEGIAGLRDYLLTRRREDFVRTFCRKLLGYSLGRSVTLSDHPLIDIMQERLAAASYRFSAALETVLTSRQFLERRALEATREAEH